MQGVLTTPLRALVNQEQLLLPVPPGQWFMILMEDKLSYRSKCRTITYGYNNYGEITSQLMPGSDPVSDL